MCVWAHVIAIHFTFGCIHTQVQCIAISVPRADTVVWSFAGRELNFSTNNTPFYRHEEYESERVSSTLTLLDPTSSYLGDYNCTVINAFGTDSAVIKLTTHGESFFFLCYIYFCLSIVIHVEKNQFFRSLQNYKRTFSHFS